MNFLDDSKILFTLDLADRSHGDESTVDNENKGGGRGFVLECTAHVATVTLAGMMMLVGIEGDEKSSFTLDCGLEETMGFQGRRCEYMEVCRNRDSTHGLLLLRPGGVDDNKKEEYCVLERIGSGFMQVMTFEAADPLRKNLRLG
jgi:hypothetical protein